MKIKKRDFNIGDSVIDEYNTYVGHVVARHYIRAIKGWEYDVWVHGEIYRLSGDRLMKIKNKAQ